MVNAVTPRSMSRSESSPVEVDMEEEEDDEDAADDDEHEYEGLMMTTTGESTRLAVSQAGIDNGCVFACCSE